MSSLRTFLKNYSQSLILISSILAGSGLGWLLKEKAVVLKPFGDIFLNLLFTSVVPLVFFSISSAVAGMKDLQRLRNILVTMIVLFIMTGIISASLMIFAVKAFPPAEGIQIDMPAVMPSEKVDTATQIVRAFTTNDFVEIISKRNMLALIFFALIIGLATSLSGSKAQPFRDLLLAGNEVMGKVIQLIMLYAPIGLGAYFAYLVGKFGPELMGSYVNVVKLYYPVALGYFFVGFTFYAYCAGGMAGMKSFWRNIIPTSLTAWGTGSSVATIPTNLEAAKRIGVPEDIREVVIPIGATIHMDGSCLSAILKISFLFGIFHMDFSGIGTITTAIGIAILSGTVMSGIPGGGFLGELLIVTMYGFPPEALPIISMIGTIVDAPATMVNSVGDNVCSMLSARILNGKGWMKK